MTLQQTLHNKAMKNITKYDDVQLKKMVCSHDEQQKFIDNNGSEQMRCRACGMWDSEAIIALKDYHEEVNYGF
jgi:hypothetical protein